MAARGVLVIAGLGSGSGTGAAAARLFAKSGYSIALVARGAESINNLSKELNSAGGNAASFPVASYSAEDIRAVWASIRSHYPPPTYSVRAAIFNVGHSVWKPFLDITPQDVEECLQVNVASAFAFSREAILSFRENEIEESSGKKGILIFTGATASLRGNTTTSAFAAGKFGVRALSQSLSKEFGKENIHVVHSIIDGTIMTDLQRERRNDPEWEKNNDVRLNPESIAKSYLYLTNQDRSAWTWELDLRPAHEKW